MGQVLELEHRVFGLQTESYTEGSILKVLLYKRMRNKTMEFDETLNWVISSVLGFSRENVISTFIAARCQLIRCLAVQLFEYWTGDRFEFKPCSFQLQNPY